MVRSGGVSVPFVRYLRHGVAALMILGLLTACGQAGEGADDGAGERLEAASIAAGLVADPAAAPLDGIWSRDTDRMCILPAGTGPARRVGVVVDTTNLEGSIWTWWREDGQFHIEKTVTIPPEAAQADDLPPLLKGFGAVPPLVTDIDLSLDDRFLYVACWGTGEMRQYDVSDPRKPKLAGSVHLGGIVRRTQAWRAAPH